jgi:hypothetical protein
MKKITLILVAALFIFSSCQKTKDPGATAAVKVANEWWVTLDLGGTQDVYGIGHFKMATYNTAANDSTIWIDDYKNGWQVKFKAKVDYNTLTFSANAAQNEYYDITVNQTDGKILPKMGHSKSGNVVDSIHMKVEFSDDPGTIYEMNGVERTRFVEDDY